MGRRKPSRRDCAHKCTNVRRFQANPCPTPRTIPQSAYGCQLPLHKGASDAVLILTFLFPIGNYQRVETGAECKRKSRVKTNLSLPLKGLGGKLMNRGMPPSRGAKRRGNPFSLMLCKNILLYRKNGFPRPVTSVTGFGMTVVFYTPATPQSPARQLP